MKERFNLVKVKSIKQDKGIDKKYKMRIISSAKEKPLKPNKGNTPLIKEDI